MKRFKKVTAFFLAAVMVLAMTCTAFAAEASDFPEKPAADKEASMQGHTFAVHQIFSGRQDGDANELIDIDWGTGIRGEAFLTALQASDSFDGGNPFSGIVYDSTASFRSAQAVAKIVAGWSPNGGNARTFASLAQGYLGEASLRYTVGADDEAAEKAKIPAGYYLVVDETAVSERPDDVRNLSILQLTKEHPFTPENKTDIPELEKKVKEINDSTGTAAWKDAADYDIGDDAEFVLTGTLPTDYDTYTAYKYVFHDTLSGGLQLNEDSIRVYVQNDETVAELSGYKVATDVAVSDSEGNQLGTESLTVTFDDLKRIASVTKDSVIRVAYTAKLTEGAAIGGAGNVNTAYLEYSNDPNTFGDGGLTGKTPEDKVAVFTYELVANKVTEGPEGTVALEGAGFTLYKYNANSAEDDKYEQVGAERKDVTTFEFKGVDAGEYKLVETTVPTGYNKAEDMYFTVEAEVDVAANVTSLAIRGVRDANGAVIADASGNAVFSFAASTVAGSLTTDILNLKGVVLPATGGIGTTIFYVFGAILVVSACVLLVVKRRMSKAV